MPRCGKVGTQPRQRVWLLAMRHGTIKHRDCEDMVGVVGRDNDADVVKCHVNGSNICRGQATEQANVTDPSHCDDIPNGKG